MDNWLLLLIMAYVYIHIVMKTLSLENGEDFTQETQDILYEIEKVVSMYDGTMGMQPPHIKEEKCFPLNGHIGGVINRAINFCG